MVEHPRDWAWVGYHEMMGSRRRYRLVDVDRLCWRLRADNVEESEEDSDREPDRKNRTTRNETGAVLDSKPGGGKSGICGEGQAADSVPQRERNCADR